MAGEAVAAALAAGLADAAAGGLGGTSGPFCPQPAISAPQASSATAATGTALPVDQRHGGRAALGRCGSGGLATLHGDVIPAF